MLDLVEAAKERMPRLGLPALMGPEQALVSGHRSLSANFDLQWDLGGGGV